MHPFLDKSVGAVCGHVPPSHTQPPHTGMFTGTKEWEIKMGVGMMYKAAEAWNKSLIFMGVWDKIYLEYRFRKDEMNMKKDGD